MCLGLDSGTSTDVVTKITSTTNGLTAALGEMHVANSWEFCLCDRCVSPECHEQVYGNDPVEEGEVREPRKRFYDSCVRSEVRRKLQADWSAAR